ncbi:MAG: Holliday junction DNA helicase RuvA, partial [Chloroflexi bacterium]|nr:Holliday junction DNA helicase RuvA [Chloroflexota bacterium]
MIAHLSGVLLRKSQDEQRVIVDVGGLGYEVLLPAFVMRALEDKREGEPIDLEIYYHVSERQPRPTLIGFSRPHERAFFEKLIQVEDIGPIKAARALTLSISTIARAIEDDDVRTLRRLDGIGERTAHKIVATLRGRVAAEALLRDEGFVSAAPQSIKT